MDSHTLVYKIHKGIVSVEDEPIRYYKIMYLPIQ